MWKRALIGPLFLLSSAVTSPLDAEMLTNPGFEPPYGTVLEPSCTAIGGSAAQGWVDNSCWTGNDDAEVTYTESGDAHGGASAQEVANPGGVLQFAQQVSLQSEMFYTASVWMRSPEPVRVNLMLRQLESPYASYVSESFDLTPTWTEYTIAGVAADTEAYFMIQGEAAGSFTVDDASLTGVPLPPPDAGMLTNPGFEPPFATVPGSCNDIGGFVALGWVDNSCWPDNETASVTYAAELVGAHGGTSAQRVANSSGFAQLAQQVTLESDMFYTASVWMRSDDPPVRVTLMLREYDAPYTEYVRHPFDLTDVWTEYRIIGVAAESEAFFMIQADAAGSFMVDDASLTGQPWSLAPNDDPVPSSFFGMHFHDGNLPWPDGLGISGVRIWDTFGGQWRDVHTGPGVFVWDALDQHVYRALNEGADVTYVLGRTPTWASARPDEESWYSLLNPPGGHLGEAAEPADIQTWRDWVTAVGTRYQGQITNWEIWNEPNDHWFYSGSIETLINLAAEAHSILKGIDSNNTVLTPSPYTLEYLDDYIAAGGANYADVIGYHFYIIGYEPEVLYDARIPGARVILQNHGLDHMPLWNTEAGWFALPTLDEPVGVAYVARSYLLNWARGVSRFHYYEWDRYEPAGIHIGDPETGLLSPTAAGVAYGECARWLVGSRMSDLTVDGSNTWVIELTLPSDAKMFVVWNPGCFDFTLDFVPPPNWDIVRMHTLAGDITAVSMGSSVPIDIRPVLLMSRAAAGSECLR